jgi:hypothetical protein
MGKAHSGRLSDPPFCLPRTLLCVLFLACCSISSIAQQSLTNDDIVQLVKGGIPESVILNAMASQMTKFDVSAQALVALKRDGVSERLIQWMLAIATGSKAEGSTSDSPVVSPLPNVPGSAAIPRSASEPRSDAPTPLASSAVFATDFSAVQVSSDGASAAPRTVGRLYVGSERLRFEETTTGGAVITIVDPQSMMGKVIAPGKTPQTVRKFSGIKGFAGNSGLSKFFLPVNPDNPCARYKGVVHCEALESEEVNDRSTTKWEFTHAMGGQTWSSYEWIDSTLHIAIKLQFENHVIELRDIQEGVQPRKLFEITSRERESN